jgi:chromatin assembly factor 1 subunit A
MDPPRFPLTTLKTANGNLPSSSAGAASKPVKPFFAPASSIPPPQPQSSATAAKPKKLLPPEEMQRFKEAVEGNNLSKVGLIEVLKKQFPKATAAAVKGTLESVARRVGNKEVDKRWVIVDGM